MKRTIVTTTLLTTLSLGSILTYTQAMARTDIPANPTLRTRTYIVRYGELDLSTLEGTAVLFKRLKHAAKIVCEPQTGREWIAASAYTLCIDKAVADAVATVNRPLLSQLYAMQTKDAKAGRS